MNPLAQRLARGDETAFAELYDICAERVHRYLVLRLACREDAADVLQETFVRLVRSRRQLKDADNLVAYVFTSARNEAARFQSRCARERRRNVGIAQVVPERSEQATDLERAETVQTALGSLNEEQREVVVLKVYGELTFREIAEITGLPQGTLATRYRAALERLRGALAREMS
jgi:RNA polymerase sigma-70 factor (ECF subfamily)